MPRSRRLSSALSSLAAGLALCAAPTETSAQERLHLSLFSDEALHRLTLAHDQDLPTYEVDFAAGVDGALTRGAAPAPARPFAAFAGLGFGARRTATDLIQLRSQIEVPLPFSFSGAAGPMRLTDLEGAHRVRGQIGLGGVDGEKLERGRGGVDIEVEGALWHGGKYGTSYVRRDIGPYPFLDASARATLWPRLAFERDGALTLPVAAELRHVEVDRPDGVYAFTSHRLSSGFGLKPYSSDFTHGWLEIVGAGWEQVAFAPPSGAPRPKLGGVERLDLRFLHVDGAMFAPNRDISGTVDFMLAGNWLHDPNGGASVSTFAGSLGGAVHGYPELGKGRSEISFGGGVLHDATFLADGSALTRRWRVEGLLEGSFLDRRAGGSVRAAAEQLRDTPTPDHPFRGAVAAEWFFAPVKHLALGMDYTSTQQCVSAATAAGPAWCHRFGLFVRADGHWKDREREEYPEAPPTPEPPPPEPPPKPVAQ